MKVEGGNKTQIGDANENIIGARGAREVKFLDYVNVRVRLR